MEPRGDEVRLLDRASVQTYTWMQEHRKAVGDKAKLEPVLNKNDHVWAWHRLRKEVTEQELASC
jgi:hypothetical protein